MPTANQTSTATARQPQWEVIIGRGKHPRMIFSDEGQAMEAQQRESELHADPVRVRKIRRAQP